MRYPQPLTIPLCLARGAGVLDRQIAERIARAIAEGILVPGARMPSTRTLAATLGVSRGVAAAAYQDLATGGHLVARRGSGTYVAGRDGAAAPFPKRHGAAATAGDRPVECRAEPGLPGVDLTPGAPTAASFPLAAWRAAWRSASLRPPPADPPPALGIPQLRKAIAGHLLRTRGLRLDGYQLAVTAGVAHGLRTLLTAVLPPGATVGLPDPAPRWLHQTLSRYGRLVPLSGEDVVYADGCAAVVLAADGAVPLGRVMPVRWRTAALRWAARTGAHLINLSRDAEFPRGAALPPLLSPPGTAGTVLLGDFAELFTPALPIGYAVLPARLAGPFAACVADRAEQPAHLAQRALAHLLEDGTATRLMHRGGRLRAWHEKLVGAALRRYGLLRPGTPGAALLYPDGWDAQRVTVAAGARGVRVPTLAEYHWYRRDAPDALVLGYGHLTEAPLRRALAVLGEVISGACRPQPDDNPAAVEPPS